MDFQNDNEKMNNFWDFKAKVDYVDNWLLMGSPIPVLIIWLSYLLFVLKLGPDYMKKRPAFNLNGALIVYNILQVIYSAYIVYVGLKILKPVNYIFVSCANEETTRNITSIIHIYFLGKVSELMDTVFFILRKKQNQVSFLHVYHHTFMVMYTWLMLKFEPSYTSIFSGSLNSFVHVVMYSYYGLSIFPSLSKYLWWKKYITVFQLIQFSLIFLHALLNFTTSECPPSAIFFAVSVFISASFTYLFGKFYIQLYLKKQKKN